MSVSSLSALLLLASAPSYSVELQAGGPNKILVVKILREATGLGLRETVLLVNTAPQRVKEQLELAAAEALAAKLRAAGATAVVSSSDGSAPKPGPAPGQVEQRATVTLMAYGAKKIEVIKIVRDVTGLRLKETKELVERAPAVVRGGLTTADAEALALRLRDAGATVTVAKDP